VSGSLKSPHSKPAPYSAYYRALFLSQWEDGLLLAGGLVATLSASLTGILANSVVVVALLIAAYGKAVPSLFAQAWATPPGPFKRRKGSYESIEEARPPSSWAPIESKTHRPNARDNWTILGDTLLIIFATAAAYAYWPHQPALTEWFLGLLGVGFVAEASVSLAEQYRLSCNLDACFAEGGDDTGSRRGRAERRHPKPTPSAALGARTVEAVLLLIFGFSAVLLAAASVKFATGEGALGLAALGKAVPSLVVTATASSSTSSST
jgi:hypothetical protein